jgi:hypothetical protein
VVECLPSKGKALNSKPALPKRGELIRKGFFSKRYEREVVWISEGNNVPGRWNRMASLSKS